MFQVASVRVFQVVGIMYIIFGVIGKFGAFFVTIPYSVVGGMQMINFGVLIGVMLSNLQFIDLNSTRNLAIIGLSMLIGLMMPYWFEKSPEGIHTGKRVYYMLILFVLILLNIQHFYYFLCICTCRQ
jgi:nucleobase transporter 1/2